MRSPDFIVRKADSSARLHRITHIIYALHGFSAVMGLLGSAFILTAFLSGWPSILGVLLNYFNRSDVRGTYLETHFIWQIRTFWYSFLWIAIAAVLAFTIIGIPLAWILIVIIGSWIIYRIARGWIALTQDVPLPVT
jgi:uncharacterized membrane protein